MLSSMSTLRFPKTGSSTKRESSKPAETHAAQNTQSRAQENRRVLVQNSPSSNQIQPIEWIQKISMTTGLPYFFNVVTGQSTWQLRVAGSQGMYYDYNAQRDLAYNRPLQIESGIAMPFQPYPVIPAEQGYYVHAQPVNVKSTNHIGNQEERVHVEAPKPKANSVLAADSIPLEVRSQHNNKTTSEQRNIAKQSVNPKPSAEIQGSHFVSPAAATLGNHTKVVPKKNPPNGAPVPSYQTLQIAKDDSKSVLAMLEDGSTQFPGRKGISQRSVLDQAAPSAQGEKFTSPQSAESRGNCRACGREVLTSQARVCEEGSYFHSECHEILVEAIETAKREAREKTIAQLHANKGTDMSNFTRTIQQPILNTDNRRDMQSEASKPQSRGPCGICGEQVLTIHTRVCAEGQYYHKDCYGTVEPQIVDTPQVKQVKPTYRLRSLHDLRQGFFLKHPENIARVEVTGITHS
mmetsp:Transcript_8489/g.28456  ORF Transcript_8489/g.28456 Transcript_8489/m.28456 type:complete len:463 (-) Transcript_8489:318-1706(-)